MANIFNYDETGAIVPDGIDSPAYVIDCMNFEYMDGKTGRWVSKCTPPPREYFNCLRFLKLRAVGFPQYKTDGVIHREIRDIELKNPREITNQDHAQAMQMSLWVWSKKLLESNGIEIDNVEDDVDFYTNGYGQIYEEAALMTDLGCDLTFPMLTPYPQEAFGVTSPAFTAMSTTIPPELNQEQPLKLTSAFSGNSFGSFDPLPRMVALGHRADSVIPSIESGSTSPTQTSGKNGSSGRFEDSPTHHPKRRQLSALAPVFSLNRIGTGMAPINPALNSKAALPHESGQFPGTFDVVALRHKDFTVLRVHEAPFNITINEVLNHLRLCEREGIVNYGSDNPAVHIVQDRADSKTHEVFVEMLDWSATQSVLNNFPKRGVKVGSTGATRVIKLEVVSREVMIKAIFPRPGETHSGKFNWIKDEPDLKSIPDPFIGYLTGEDLHHARQWAEHPRKAKFAEDCPQRVYEFMITTLLKLPQTQAAYGTLSGWDYNQFIERLFLTVRTMIQTLNRFIDDPKFASRHLPEELHHLLSFRLLKRLNQTAYDFPLFTSTHKHMLISGSL